MALILNKAKALKNNAVNDNLIINGNFDIWQRGTPFYAGGFTADRWYMISNGSNKASRIAGNVGLENANNIIRLQTLSSGSYPILSQAIDSDISSGLRGKTTTFSFYAKKPSGSNWNDLVYGKVFYSTDINSIANGKIEILDAAFSGSLSTDTWTRYSRSFVVPGNASTLLVQISSSGPLNDSSIIDIGQAKLENATSATNIKSSIYNEELNKCKRYYQRVEAVLKAGTGAGNSSRKFGISTPLPVLPRSKNAKLTITKNSNNLIDSFSANISDNSYLNVTANAKNLYSELSLEFIIDDEIPYGKSPGIIDSVTAIRGTGKIDIDWNPPVNSDSSISYSVLYGTSPIELNNIFSFSDSTGSITGLVDSSPYYIRLYSINSYGQSDLSNLFEIAPSYNIPSGISSLTGLWTFDKTIINWSPPSGDGGSPITGYRIDRSMYSDFPSVSSVINYNSTFYTPIQSTTTALSAPSVYYNSNNKLEFSIAKFTPELTTTGNYYFRVTPMNLAGTGESSSFTLQKTAPSAPLNLSPTAGDSSVTLSYLPPTGNGGNTISIVNLERSTTGTFATVVSTNHTANYQPIIVTGLTNNTNYYFRMRAYNQIGYGPYTSGVLAVPNRAVTVPGSLSGLTPSWVDDDTVSLIWNAPQDNGGTPIINYTLYVASGSGFTSNLLTYTTQNSISSMSFDVPITGNYNTFYFRGKSNNSVGSSSNSSIASLNKEVPGTPIFSLVQPGDTTVSTEWLKPISKGSVITGYNLQYSTDSSFNTSVTNIWSTGLKYTISSLSNNTLYNFRVRAINSIGTGSFSSTMRATPISPLSVPTAPSFIQNQGAQYAFNAISSFTALPDNLNNMENYKNNIGNLGLPTFSVRITTPYSGGSIYGVNPYTSNSDIRTAAIHAGALSSSQTGIVYLYVINPLSSYSSIVRNGLTSSSTGSYQGTYYIRGSNIKSTGFTNLGTTGLYIPFAGWYPPTNNGGSAITGYELQYAGDFAFTSNLSTFSIPGNVTVNPQYADHNGMDWVMRVRAVNSSGPSAWTTYGRFPKGLAPAQPPTSFIASQLSSTGLSLSWIAPSGPAGSGYDSPSNIKYGLTHWNINTPLSKTYQIYNTNTGLLSVAGPASYVLSLQTLNFVYFYGASANTINYTVTANNSPTSWVFSYYNGIYPGTSAPTQASLSDNIWDQQTSVWGSNIGTNNYLVADFGSIKNVSKITVGPISRAYGAWGWRYLNGSVLQYSNDNINWTTITTIPTIGDQSQFSTSINTSVSARYIRVLMSEPIWLGIGTLTFA